MLYTLLAQTAQQPTMRDLPPTAVDAVLEAVSVAGEHIAWDGTLGSVRALADAAPTLGDGWGDVDRVVDGLARHIDTHGGFVDVEDEEADTLMARLARDIPASAHTATIALVARAGYDHESAAPAYGNEALVARLGEIFGLPDAAGVAATALASAPGFVWDNAFHGYRSLHGLDGDLGAAAADALRRLGVPCPDPSPAADAPAHTLLCVTSGYYGALVLYQLPPEHRTPALDRGLDYLSGKAMASRLDLHEDAWPDVSRVLIALGWGLRSADHAYRVHVDQHLPHLPEPVRAAMPDPDEVAALHASWNLDRVAWVDESGAELDPPLLQRPLDRVVSVRLD